ncbi:MAG: formate dehydrogenase accessory sulfurtransferase FdhD [Acidimicrobiia bacterium]|nr:formate dehydrogenase accessory sulfurtransferase FdhD [Acidimicrobiia bacterium]
MTTVQVRSVDGGAVRERPDRLATEEPMEIRVQGPRGKAEPVAVTMRTPGHDFELAVGFLLTEGVLTDPADIASVAYCLEGTGEQQYNVVTVRTRCAPDPERARRTFAVSASCGVCGKATLDEIEVMCTAAASGPTVASAVLVGLPDKLRAEQSVFDATGGLHAAGCFGVDGSLTALREDVGRHNALDKVIGWAAMEQSLPLANQVLMVSGRVSFEIVQKAAIAGIPIVCAVSAPTSLAVDAAKRLNLTLVGFLRDDHFNVYCGDERIAAAT